MPHSVLPMTIRHLPRPLKGTEVESPKIRMKSRGLMRRDLRYEEYLTRHYRSLLDELVKSVEGVCPANGMKEGECIRLLK